MSKLTLAQSPTPPLAPMLSSQLPAQATGGGDAIQKPQTVGDARSKPLERLQTVFLWWCRWQA